MTAQQSPADGEEALERAVRTKRHGWGDLVTQREIYRYRMAHEPPPPLPPDELAGGLWLANYIRHRRLPGVPQAFVNGVLNYLLGEQPTPVEQLVLPEQPEEGAAGAALALAVHQHGRAAARYDPPGRDEQERQHARRLRLDTRYWVSAYIVQLFLRSIGVITDATLQLLGAQHRAMHQTPMRLWINYATYDGRRLQVGMYALADGDELYATIEVHLRVFQTCTYRGQPRGCHVQWDARGVNDASGWLQLPHLSTRDYTIVPAPHVVAPTDDDSHVILITDELAQQKCINLQKIRSDEERIHADVVKEALQKVADECDAHLKSFELVLADGTYTIFEGPPAAEGHKASIELSSAACRFVRKEKSNTTVELVQAVTVNWHHPGDARPVIGGGGVAGVWRCAYS